MRTQPRGEGALGDSVVIKHVHGQVEEERIERTERGDSLANPAVEAACGGNMQAISSYIAQDQAMLWQLCDLVGCIREQNRY